MKNDLVNSKVGDLVAQNFRAARVLTDYGIDFCCNGGVTLSKACERKGLDAAVILQSIQEAMKSPDGFDFDDMPVVDLIDRIVQLHHQYVRATMPALSYYLEKIARVHGDRHPELKEVQELFSRTATALPLHMQKEEVILFPYIQAMVQAAHNNQSLSDPHFGHIDHPISMMVQEHETEGENLRQIAGLTNQYTCQEDACQTYRVAYAMLQEFEEDLHLHIHLENNILFPKAKLLYDKVIENQNNR